MGKIIQPPFEGTISAPDLGLDDDGESTEQLQLAIE